MIRAALLAVAALLGTRAPHPALYTGPAWSTDGRIAWSQAYAGTGLWVARSDGTHARRVSRASGQVAWLPGGDLLLGTNRSLVRIDPGGRRSVVLRTAWFDGFVTDRRGTLVALTEPRCGSGCAGPIRIVGLAAPHHVVLTGGRATNESPSFSPGGTELAYLREIDPVAGTLAVASVATGRFHVLAGTAGALCPVWSPHADVLAYVSPDGVRLVAVHGGASRLVYAARGIACGALAWSPDGRRLVTTLPSGRLAVVDVAGGSVHRLPPAVTELAWSPDARRLLVTTRQGRCSTLAVVTATGGTARSLRRSC
jgi:hypothetical protein